MYWEDLSRQLSEAAAAAINRQSELVKFEADVLGDRRARLERLSGGAARSDTQGRDRAEALSEAIKKRSVQHDTRARLELEAEMMEHKCNAASDKLAAYCVENTIALRSDRDGGLEAWTEWLTNWHIGAKRAWEPGSDPERQLISRGVVDAAESLWADLTERVERDPPPPPTVELSENDIAARCQTYKNQADRSSDDLLRFVVEPSRHLRIVEDLPDPEQGKSLSELREIHNVLSFLEVLLGRYAQSAALEEQTLEAID
ncbi:MAG: hypothetical protein WC815_04080 [Vicinamibacterales bacterium]|jgi:hypothetical protein